MSSIQEEYFVVQRTVCSPMIIERYYREEFSQNENEDFVMNKKNISLKLLPRRRKRFQIEQYNRERERDRLGLKYFRHRRRV